MNVVLFGKRGRGKSYYLKKLVKDTIFPVVIVDTLDEYGSLAIKKEISSKTRFDCFKIRFIPMNEEEFIVLTRWISKIKYYAKITIVYEEIDQWSSEHQIQTELHNLIKFSRHYNFDIYFSVQTPARLNKTIPANSNHLYIWKVSEPLYLEYFKKHDSRLPGMIMSLKGNEFVDYNIDVDDEELEEKMIIRKV